MLLPTLGPMMSWSSAYLRVMGYQEAIQATDLSSVMQAVFVLKSQCSPKRSHYSRNLMRLSK